MVDREQSPFFESLMVQTTAENIWGSATQTQEPFPSRELELFLESLKGHLRLQFRFAFGDNYKNLISADQTLGTDYGSIYLKHHLEEVIEPDGTRYDSSIDSLRTTRGEDWALEAVLESSLLVEDLTNAKISYQGQSIDIISRR